MLKNLTMLFEKETRKKRKIFEEILEVVVLSFPFTSVYRKNGDTLNLAPIMFFLKRHDLVSR